RALRSGRGRARPRGAPLRSRRHRHPARARARRHGRACGRGGGARRARGGGARARRIVLGRARHGARQPPLPGARGRRGRRPHGGEVVALTMGPPGARDGLVECLALGADRALHLLDPLLAGSDTLATARALAAVLLREAPDLVLFGRASTDAETGQVGPEVAEMLDLPQVTGARRLELDPAARTFVAERETDEGFETVTGPLAAVVTAAEDLAEERFPTKAERQAAAAKSIATLGAAEVGLASDDVGAKGSPTWVAGIEQVPSTR